MLQTSPKPNYTYSYGKNSNRSKNRENNNKKKNDISIITVVFYTFFVFMIMILTASYIGQFVQIAHLNYELSDLDNYLKEVKTENDALSLALAKERSIVKVENIARNELGMVDAEDVQVLVLNSSEKNTDDKIVPDKEEMFLARFVSNIWDMIGTVKAGEIE